MSDISQASAILTIDLAALVANWRQMAARAAPAQAAAVVKADAYGLGARQVVPALVAAGCRHFFVAQLAEALAIRDLVPQDGLLAVLNGLNPQAEAAAAQAGVVPVLNSVGQARRWMAEAQARGATLPAIVQVDTGMARHGLSAQEALALAGDAGFGQAVSLVAVMSHLACADEPDHPENAAALARFSQVASAFAGVPRCFANSGGVLLGGDYIGAQAGDLVRPGIAIYGGQADDGRASPLAPVVRLEARVIQTRCVPQGTGVGYGQVWHAPRPSWLATLAIGYADGFLRSLSGCGAVWARGFVLPVVGRVSMDATIVDSTALYAAQGELAEGELVEVIGPHRPLDTVAHEAGTIGYEMLTQLGRRHARVYLPA